MIDAGVIGQVNNFMGAAFVGLRYRDTYNRDPDNELFDELYWQAGVTLATSVYLTQFALQLEWVPIAVLRLRLSYKGNIVPGIPSTFGTGLTFETKNDRFGQEVLESRKGDNIVAYSHNLVFEPTLQAKLWKVILLNNFGIAYNYVHGRGDFLYDNLTDSLIRRGEVDWGLQEQAVVLFDVWQGDFVHKLYLGPLYQYNLAVRANIERQRLGGMVLYSPVERWSVFREPTLMLSAGANLVDRHRAGQPYFLILLKSGFPVGEE